jgi:hypothetical protein
VQDGLLLDGVQTFEERGLGCHEPDSRGRR